MGLAELVCGVSLAFGAGGGEAGSMLAGCLFLVSCWAFFVVFGLMGLMVGRGFGYRGLAYLLS